jgi:hypothetical protein
MTPRAALTPLLAVPFLLCSLAGTASGQSGALQKRLASATRVSCTFSQMATATWKAGTPVAEVAASQLTVNFSNVNVDEGTADAEGTFGGSFIVVRYSNDYLHLMQTHSAGPLYTTTVLARESKAGRLMAVHTRHEYTDVRLPGYTSRPEMYVGDCAVS